MNKRGQFSIIAALLVAVVLIATVIITYSTIRNFPTGEQPQVLSAIDETNFALKQILGFTVGYYGSILQVTGDREYANGSAYKYLVSGLEYIARMHPERAVSFNLSELDLQTYWFTSQSYTQGKIAVKYDLTGLGIYGITYETSCKLSVNVTGTGNNQARIRVTVDEEDEPLIKLGKSNFKFYRYSYSSSTWELVSPTNEPTAFADGTYLIDFPSGIDQYSYVVQVVDPRGIVTVASSFSRYVCTLNWNPNITLIDRESFEGSWLPVGWSTTNWTRTSDQKYDGTYSAKFQKSGGISFGNLTSCSLDCSDAVSIYIDFWYNSSVSQNSRFSLQFFNGNAWVNVAELGSTSRWSNYRLRITDSQFFKSNFKMRWSAINLGGNDKVYVDYITVKKEINLPAQSEPIVVELLQNGTMRWLGQNLNLATQVKPIPPIPVKAMRVNQTINGVNREVPFQIEDWASDYRIPLGLTNNASVFNNRNMLVFLANRNVSKVTIWWNGSDTATQTPLAYTNRYFNDNPSAKTLRNGKLTVQLSSSGFTITTTTATGGMSSTARFMRINSRYDTTDPEWAYTIINGVVRDIVHGESEYSGGVTDPPCYNFYSHIVLTLPANATYYTYQLRLIFLNSADKPRTIRDICLVSISTTGTGYSALTENGTSSSGYPIVSTASGLFYNMSGIWQHHWAQINYTLTRGFGIMFPDDSNKKLYYFDSIVNSQTGALNVSSTGRTIEFLPVKRVQVSNFISPLDICWYGAVVTFDGTTPLYKKEGSNVTGLWILAEYPPSITVTTES
ncbi:MAG: hypothetical protein QW146_02560 [Candidatus Bathyarchaeia archaeon]